jgi:hypothetical protein
MLRRLPRETPPPKGTAIDQHRATGPGSGRAQRRILVAGLAGGALTAGAAAVPQRRPDAEPLTGAGAEPDAARPVLARTTDVPVGGVVVVGNVELAQPASGTFRAFSAVCPHRTAARA